MLNLHNNLSLRTTTTI